MTMFTELDYPSEVKSSYGEVLEQHPTLLRHIMQLLPAPQGKPDAVARVLAIYRWLHFAGAKSAVMHRGWQREWSVSMRLHTDLGVGGVHHEVRVIDSSTGTRDGVPHAWLQLSEEQANRALRQAQPAGVARWMQALHQAEQQAAQEQAGMLVVKILPRDTTQTLLLALDEYLEHAVERRRHVPYISFHPATPDALARIQARRLGTHTLDAQGMTQGRRL